MRQSTRIATSFCLGLLLGLGGISIAQESETPKDDQGAETAEPKSQKKGMMRARKGNAASNAALKEAVSTLLDEYRQYANDPANAAPLRTTSDYFAAGLPETIGLEEILVTIAKPVDRNAGADAYARWQLLSGLPAELPEEVNPYLLNAYRSAPSLVIRPGITQESRNELSRTIAKAGVQEDQANEEFNQYLARHDALNGPIVAFRNELLSRCPDDVETFALAMEDAYERLNGGASKEMNDLLRQVSSRVGTWAASAKPVEVKRIGTLVNKLRDQKPIEYYESVRTNDNAGYRLEWEEKELKFDTPAARDLENVLAESLREQGADTKKATGAGKKAAERKKAAADTKRKKDD